METTTHSTGDTSHESARPRLVEIELNGITRHIAGGKYTGRSLKLALGVPVDHELDIVVHGEFSAIGNDQAIEVRGAEKFVSHCGQGQSA